MISKPIIDLFLQEIYKNPEASKQSHKCMPEEAMVKYIKDQIMMSEYSQDCPYPEELHHKVFTDKERGFSFIFINQPYFDDRGLRYF